MREITEAINAVMQAAKHVTKDSINAHHKYNFTSEAEVITAIRAPMAKNGLSIFPYKVEILEFTTSGKMYRYDILAIYRMYHCSGQYIDIHIPASGVDTQDKALPKAMTMALKYALIQTFILARGIDPDEEKTNLDELQALQDENAEYVKHVEQQESKIQMLLEVWGSRFNGLEAVNNVCKSTNKPLPVTWSETTFNNFMQAVDEGKIEECLVQNKED